MPNEIRELKSVYFKELKGLRDVTIDFGDNDNRITGIFGLNGSGKSTILHTIMCIYAQDANSKNCKVPSEFIADTQMSRYFKHIGGQYWQNSEYSVTFMYEHKIDSNHSEYRIEKDSKIYKKYYRSGGTRKVRSEWVPRKAAKRKRNVFYLPIKSCIPDIEGITIKSPGVGTKSVIAIANDKILTACSRIMGRTYSDIKHVETLHLKHDGYSVLLNNATQYHSLSMGAGEQRLLRMLEVLFNAPRKSLIIIDEIDLTLHTAALKELFVVMQRVANDNKLQIVFTSHRQEILNMSGINVRFIINTPHQTYCLDNPTVQCYELLTGQPNKYLNVFVEDDTSYHIVEKILMQHKIHRNTHIYIAGAASNAIPIACALEVQRNIENKDENRKNTLFVLDGDVSVTPEEKMKTINRTLSGTGEEFEQKRANVLSTIVQYNSIESKIQHGKNMCPEEFILEAIKELPENGDNPEIIHEAKRSPSVLDVHDCLNQILDQGYNIHDILNTFRSNTVKWNNYVQTIDQWAADRAEDIQRDLVE